MKNKYLQLQHSLNLGTSRTSKSEITAQHDQGPISGMHTMLRGTEKRTTKKPVWLLFLPQILRIYFPCSKKNYEHTPIEARNTSYCVYWLSTAIATLTCLKNPARLLSALPSQSFHVKWHHHRAVPEVKNPGVVCFLFPWPPSNPSTRLVGSNSKIYPNPSTSLHFYYHLCSPNHHCLPQGWPPPFPNWSFCFYCSSLQPIFQTEIKAIIKQWDLAQKHSNGFSLQLK